MTLPPSIQRAFSDGAAMALSSLPEWLATLRFLDGREFQARGESLAVALASLDFALLLHYNDRDLRAAMEGKN